MSPGEKTASAPAAFVPPLLCGLALGHAVFLALLRLEITGPSFAQAAGLAPAIVLLGLSLGVRVFG